MQKFAGDVKKARTFADDAVSRAQGSGDFIDKTAFQRGTVGDKVRQSEYIRAASALQGYMLAKGNIAYEQIRTKRPHKLAENMVMLFVVDAMLAQVIRHGLPEDEDKDGWRIDDFIARAAKEGGSAVMGTVPGLGALASELRGYDSKGVVASAMESVANAYEQTSQGKLDKALVKSYAQLAGFAFGFPAGAFKSLVETMAAMRTAQARAPADVSGKDWAEDAAK